MDYALRRHIHESRLRRGKPQHTNLAPPSNARFPIRHRLLHVLFPHPQRSTRILRHAPRHRNGIHPFGHRRRRTDPLALHPSPTPPLRPALDATLPRTPQPARISSNRRNSRSITFPPPPNHARRYENRSQTSISLLRRRSLSLRGRKPLTRNLPPSIQRRAGLFRRVRRRASRDLERGYVCVANSDWFRGG